MRILTVAPKTCWTILCDDGPQGMDGACPPPPKQVPQAAQVCSCQQVCPSQRNGVVKKSYFLRGGSEILFGISPDEINGDDEINPVVISSLSGGTRSLRHGWHTDCSRALPCTDCSVLCLLDNTPPLTLWNISFDRQRGVLSCLLGETIQSIEWVVAICSFLVSFLVAFFFPFWYQISLLWRKFADYAKPSFGDGLEV